jgi:cytoskeletal protein CcmA (bactofilin family)
MNPFTLSRNLTVTGEISADEDLVIDGTVNGTIRVPGHAIVIGPGAEIKADVLAKHVDIRLVVEEGAEINGQLDTRNADAAVSVARYRAERT